MALNQNDISGYETLAREAAREGDQSWWWTPETVPMAQAPTVAPAPTRHDVLTGTFRFPAPLVDAHAQMLVEEGRREGERHSLALWRAGLRAALERLAREASGASSRATCAALFWERSGDDYHVAVTFEAAGATLAALRH